MISKVVIPVAGKGTRFLPATKEVPKEMLPILNTPMIQYVVDEAVGAGLKQVIFVNSRGKEALENYFRPNSELESFLKRAQKEELLQKIVHIGNMVDIQVVYQDEQLGLGHAVACAEKLVKGEDFAVILGDDLVLADKPCIQQLIEQSEKNQGASVIGVMEVERKDTDKYGIVDGKVLDDPRLLQMSQMIEKPRPEQAPTTLATPGRYVLKNEIFDCLRSINRGAGGEYQLTDAINLLAQKQTVLAYQFYGERYDTGNILGHFEATIEFALRDPSLKEQAQKILRDKLQKFGV